MNKLSYKIELTEIVEGYLKCKGEAFFYVVDGRKLEYQNYSPALETTTRPKNTSGVF